MKKFVALLAALALALIGLVATSASADGYSTDQSNPTLVEVVPEGFEALGDPTETTEDCITTTEQVFSRTTSGSEASYGPWSAWTETQSNLFSAPTVPSNTDIHEWRVVGPVKVIDVEGTEDQTVTVTRHFSYTGGPIAGTPAPPTSLDDEDWQPNAEQEPPGHLNSHNAPGGGAYTGTGLHYASHGNSGLADWFFFGPVTTVIPGVEEESHSEWAVEERTRTFTPAGQDVTEYVFTSVTEGEPCTEEPPTEEPPVVEPPVVEPPSDSNEPKNSPEPQDDPAPVQRKAQKTVEVPTVINSGL